MGERQPRSPSERLRGDDGVALVITLLCITLLMALGIALLANIDAETRIASNYRDGVETFYAADAAVERALQDVQVSLDWNSLLNGSTRSTFADGPPGGMRTLPDGTTIDLTQTTNILRCGTAAVCSDAAMDATTGERPWGVNNPRWQLYAYGLLRDMLAPGQIDSRLYVAVWVADDPSDNDGRPLEDGGLSSNPGRGVLRLLSHAYGPSGGRRVVEVTVARVDSEDPASGVRILSWRDVR